MSEFKIGQNVWFFEDDSYCIDLFVENIELSHKLITREDEEGYYPYGYRSRREALEGLSKRLKELLDNE